MSNFKAADLVKIKSDCQLSQMVSLYKTYKYGVCYDRTDVSNVEFTNQIGEIINTEYGSMYIVWWPTLNGYNYIAHKRLILANAKER